MGLPKIKFNITSDGLGRVGAGVQKVPAMVLTGAAVTGKVELGKSYQIFSLKNAEDLGITKTDNAFANKHIQDFYGQAQSGAELWIMLVSDATTMTAMVDQTQSYAKKLIEDAKGKVRILGVCKKSVPTATITDGLDADSHTAVEKAQNLGAYFQNKYMPIRVLISGNNFSGIPANLKDYSGAIYNKVAMLIAGADTAKDAAIGLAIGRLAKIPTQRSIARVKDGAAIAEQAYFTNGQSVETLVDAWDTIHDKGYIFLRSFQGKSGYYFSSDKTATSSTDDFSSISRGRVIDKALLIAYTTYVNEINDEMQLDSSGKMSLPIVKFIESNIENAINGNMSEAISFVKGYIDPIQNILSDSILRASLKIIPVAYSTQIEVTLGFSNPTLTK